MELLTLRTRCFRNLVPASVKWMNGPNLVCGGNGHGKTNLLEAIVVLGNLRSFRAGNLRRLVRHGERGFGLEGEIHSARETLHLEHVYDLGPPPKRQLRVNGAEVDVAYYLHCFPVFAIAPSDRDLVLGEPAARRAFVDRFAFLIDSRVLDHLRTYRRCLRQRNSLLGQPASATEFDVWDSRLAAAAATVVSSRVAAVERLAGGFQVSYDALRGEGFPEVELAYRCESWLDMAQNDLEPQYRQRLTETRDRDRASGFTADGPHRHDLLLRADGQPARHVLSSGQTRVVAAALRLASLGEVERSRGERLPMVVDDVDSELDREVADRLIAHLGQSRQLFLSSPHDNGFGATLSTVARRFMRQGQCVHQTVEKAHG